MYTNLFNLLNEKGYFIIPKLLNDEEIKNMNDGMWNYLEHITSNFDIPIKRNDKTSWKSFYDLYPIHSMLIQHWSIGHAQHIWNLRQNPKVVDIFSEIWNCKREELLCSFDSSSFHLPPEETNIGYFNDYWLHCDQSFTRNDFECVQSWITGYDVNEEDATLVVIESSHKFHKEFKEHFNIKRKEDWFQLNDIHIQFFLDRGCNIKRISCPAGSMVLWDSRVIHCGSEPIKGRAQSNFRNVSYICMMPRKLATCEDLQNKQKAFKDLRTTSHWAYKAKLSFKFPNTHGKPLPNVKEIEPPILTNLGMRLAGFN